MARSNVHLLDQNTSGHLKIEMACLSSGPTKQSKIIENISKRHADEAEWKATPLIEIPFWCNGKYLFVIIAVRINVNRTEID